MTAADIIMIFIGIIGLPIAFGSFVIALLTFLDKRNVQGSNQGMEIKLFPKSLSMG